MPRKLSLNQQFLIFVILSIIGAAQLGWWIIFQVREGQRVHAQQTSIWDQQVATVREWRALHSGQPDEFAAMVRQAFPDLEILPGGTAQVRREARDRLDDIANRRVRMFISEGAFFSLLLAAGVWYLYWLQHRELSFEKRQSMFLSATSHELKTPITSLRLYLDTLRDRPLPPEKHAGVLATMRNDVDRLTELIDRLLQAQSLMDHERASLRIRIDLAEETAQALKSMQPLLDHHGFTVDAKIEPEVFALADPERWQIVVKNLLENAVKYSPQSRWIGLELFTAGGVARLTVTDRGQGLDRAETERIFERFYRVGNEDRRGARGTGLGLYLVRRIAESFGGRAYAASPGVGGGSTFTVDIPLTEQTGHA